MFLHSFYTQIRFIFDHFLNDQNKILASAFNLDNLTNLSAVSWQANSHSNADFFLF